MKCHSQCVRFTMLFFHRWREISVCSFVSRKKIIEGIAKKNIRTHIPGDLLANNFFSFRPASPYNKGIYIWIFISRNMQKKKIKNLNGKKKPKKRRTSKGKRPSHKIGINFCIQNKMNLKSEPCIHIHITKSSKMTSMEMRSNTPNYHAIHCC